MDYFDWAAQDGVGRLKTIQAGTNAAPGSYLHLAYSYDPRGNVKTIKEATNANQQQTFTYDALSRLTSAATDGLGSGQYSQSYTYNASTGNLATKGINSYTYADVNHPHAVTQVQNALLTNSYEYDWNGNMTRHILGAPSTI